MRRKKNDKTTGKLLITVLSAFCVVLIGASIVGGQTGSPLRQVAGVFTTPIQKGITHFGDWVSGFSGNFTSSAQLREENEALQAQVDTLTAENSQLVLDKEELGRLRKLLSLADEYSDYESVGAKVISKDSGNWFSTFTIDKGSKDGVTVDCNVLSGAGLAGIVIDTGAHWATVRSIIDDNSNVSAMVSKTSDTCIIAGNLELIDSGALSLVQLTDAENKVHVGDKIVTSNISEKYLPGILIGYISELNNDANNLTKSGEITPVADFRHISEVLVILDKKDYVASPDDSANRKVIDDAAGQNARDAGEEETEA